MSTRRVIFDVETTGLKAGKPDRIIEIGCVELDGLKVTGNEYQTYVSPRVQVEKGALAVHGLTDAFLSDKPEFEDIAPDFLSFVGDAELVIHNADFDMAFLEYELRLMGLEPLGNKVFCTLKHARRVRPGKRNTLDALLAAYNIKTDRVDGVHGAIQDCRSLAKVYTHMMQTQGNHEMRLEVAYEARSVPELAPGSLVVIKPSEAELAAHREMCRD